jgi:hypothetical protein
MWEFIAAVFVFAVILGVFDGISRERKKKAALALLDQIEGFSPNVTWSSSDGDHVIAIDDSARAICLIQRRDSELSSEVISYSRIASSEIREDGETTTKANRGSQAVGVAVGALALGGLGAVIGGLSGSKRSESKVKTIELVITVDDVGSPFRKVPFLNAAGAPVKSTSLEYKTAHETAREWQARLALAIKAQLGE